MSFFDELKRRNVFRVGIAYTIGAWILVQVADILFEAIGYLLFDKFAGSAGQDMGSESNSQTASLQPTETGHENLTLTPEVSRQSIAVLPFDNRSPDPADEFFTEGIHDDLLSNLARIGSLKVISRTSVAQYKDTEKTIPVIAGELGVANIMEGAVQRAGNQVRINVQLIDAQTDEHLWAEIFDRELTAENLAAYDDYLRARQLVETRNSSKLEEAQRLFRSAVEADPEFALAWVGLADTTHLLALYGTLGVSDSFPVRREAIDHALAMDPGQWDRLIDINASWACLVGWTFVHTGDESLGKALLEKSVVFMDALPAYVEHADWQGPDICYLATGQAEKALDVIEMQLAHNHLFWMALFSRLPMYESIRHEPRYQAVLAEREKRLAAQRQSVKAILEEAGP